LQSRRAQKLAVAALIATVTLGLARLPDWQVARCGRGFRARASRCVPESVGGWCPAPLVFVRGCCDAPDVSVPVPDVSFWLGPSDWEAEGRIEPRWIHVPAFRMDAFEATVGHLHSLCCEESAPVDDCARAANAMTRDEASRYCSLRGGRLPTEDEWIAAASTSGTSTRRYPWGDTGAVCRRAAWGLSSGPCTSSGFGPDTVGAHPAGDSALGIHDLAGNVAEWVTDPSDVNGAVGVAKGGSWQSSMAAELRAWSRLEVKAESRDARIGVRCVYDP